MCFDTTAMKAIADSILVKREAQNDVIILNKGLTDCYTHSMDQQSFIFNYKQDILKLQDVNNILHNNINSLSLENQKLKKKNTILGSFFSSVGAVLIAIIVIK